ncbi:CMRF35-like molecule 1 isoform X2 [Lynx rufus]|uniref:CMRF35-like molecule 1 isoform X2 n=1 Tax=Lynx rufus TaxID=61384 RepID=UPI001F123553|nr:CMRF35-like molecule 1 isoform X2 [Lynx rufus]
MHGFLFFLFLFQLAGSSDISGPEAVRGLVGGSLTVQCHYVQTWKNSKKWWCRGANWGNCRILVKTDGSEQEVQRKNVSIKDNQKNLTFTVTMEKLKQTDANIYWCGIERYGIDLGVKVKVTVHPAPTTVSTTGSNATMSTTPAETKGPPTMTSHHYDGSCWAIPRAGDAAAGGGPLLCKPDPTANRNLPRLLPEEGLHKALLLCPGKPAGSGLCHHGPLSEGEHFLCGSVLGAFGSGANLQQHRRPRHPRSQKEP